jgi:tRNA1(Val) A37 N6-methylase TrmN6
LDEVRGALRPSFGDIAVLPVLPREMAPAIRVVVRAIKARGGPELAYPALILNDEHGRPTAAAEAILRGGKTLNIAEP